MSGDATAPVVAPTKIVLRGRKVVGGCAEGEAIVTRGTISGWGGINEREGTAWKFLVHRNALFKQANFPRSGRGYV
jgi:hypothetical protein